MVGEQSPSKISSKWPGWNLVIGIEVHAQLKTRQKLFSNSLATEDNFVPTNERVSLFDAAFPGTLPIINPTCVSLAARTALALRADIQSRSSFDRKHYFYGDLPVGYQITQNYAPFAKDGYLELVKSQKRIRIKQIQLEQDTAKSLHVGDKIQHDLNRVGMPLLEIVSHPDLSSPEEAGEYVRTLQAVLRSVAASDGMMEAGSFRCDVNVSIHRNGEPLGTRTELKNLNSVKAVVLAIDAEARRQLEILTSTELSGEERKIQQQTLTFDESTLQTRPLRTKEGVDDYRYMPDPNLLLLVVEQDTLNKLKEDMTSQGMAGPETATGEIYFGWDGIRHRLKHILGLPIAGRSEEKKHSDIERGIEVLMTVDAGRTVGWDGDTEPGAVSFFEQTVKHQSPPEPSGDLTKPRDPRIVLNWIIHDLLGQLTKRDETFAQNPISPEQLAEIIDAVEAKRITVTAGKTLIRHLLDTSRKSSAPLDPHIESSKFPLSIPQLIDTLGLAKSSSKADLDQWCQQVIDQNPELVDKVKIGKTNTIMALVGNVMKLSKGSADAVQAKALLERKILDDILDK
ncbi:hypothetical protein M408DRAFT_332902 [Serendipita vermifera MAFF 305830]|uniref:Glutamyl-tRNA(Gln) amidotransferase subunit B, mitochondrial n=1 Tax=Serendipita vermifera MAFF 305830 TaxID=933852 RepID=A0A0C3AR70_SERVB|nr:hypothetical protein M408DRAFT_332902 [Serendipita vermifera MAFF 305830]